MTPIYSVYVLNYTGETLYARSRSGKESIPPSMVGDTGYNINVSRSLIDFHSEKGTRTIKPGVLKMHSTGDDTYVVNVIVGYSEDDQKILIDADQNPVVGTAATTLGLDKNANVVYLSKKEKITLVASKIKAVVDDVVDRILSTYIKNHFSGIFVLLVIVLIIIAVIIGIVYYSKK